MSIYSKVSKPSPAPAKKPAQSKMMGRIKFGGDDEEVETAAPVEEPKKEVEQADTVKFDQNDDGSEVRIGKRTSRLCKLADLSFCLIT